MITATGLLMMLIGWVLSRVMNHLWLNTDETRKGEVYDWATGVFALTFVAGVGVLIFALLKLCVRYLP